MCLVPPSIFCSISNGSVTSRSLQFSGISCIKPFAPALDTQLGLKFDSTFIIALIKFSSTPYFLDDMLIALSILSFTLSSLFELSTLFVFWVLFKVSKLFSILSKISPDW